MRFLPTTLWRRAVAAVGRLIRSTAPESADPAETWDVTPPDSAYRWVADVFKDGPVADEPDNPDVRQILEEVRQRDALLNTMLSSYHAETRQWRAEAEAGARAIAQLQPWYEELCCQVDVVEREAHEAHTARARLEKAYVAYCAGALGKSAPVTPVRQRPAIAPSAAPDLEPATRVITGAHASRRRLGPPPPPPLTLALAVAAA